MEYFKISVFVETIAKFFEILKYILIFEREKWRILKMESFSNTFFLLNLENSLLFWAPPALRSLLDWDDPQEYQSL